MTSSTASRPFVLRALEPASETDLHWVARGMHLTLVEVEGDPGRERYPLAWTRARLEELLAPSRHATWTSAANVRLVRLYEKHGFAVTERGARDGTPMVRLSKALAP